MRSFVLLLALAACTPDAEPADTGETADTAGAADTGDTGDTGAADTGDTGEPGDTADTGATDSGGDDTGWNDTGDTGADDTGAEDTGADTGADDTGAEDTGADTAAPADDDLDGFAADEDCDDADAGVYPGAPETCDAVDEDCDGDVDEDAVDASTWYADADLDGYGDASTTVLACDAAAGRVADATDCDDGDAATWPGAPEVLGDGLDQDCDGADTPAVSIGWCNVQWPTSTTTDAGVATEAIYGQVWSDGVTNAAGAGAGILAEVGVGDHGTDASTHASWTWAAAAYNVDVGNNDEYMATLTVAVAGDYDYAYRFSGDGGVAWSYCDTAGNVSGDPYDVADAGRLTVE